MTEDIVGREEVVQEALRLREAVSAILNEVSLGELFPFIRLGVMVDPTGPLLTWDQSCPLLTCIWEVPNADDLGTTVKFRAVTEVLRKPENPDFADHIHQTARDLVIRVISHEVTEFYQYQGKRVFDPHPGGEVSPFMMRWNDG